MAKAGGWFWMGGVIAVLIAIQAVRQNEPLVSIDRALNGAHGCCCSWPLPTWRCAWDTP